MMKKKHIKEFWKQGKRIKLNLKNNTLFTGIIVSIEKDYLIFRDKFDDEIPINLDAISYICVVHSKGGKC